MTDWFAPRRFGWGWTPISWQGWALTLAFVALALWTITRFHSRPAMIAAIIVPAFVILLLVTIRTTRAG